jgi:hypothetical protein
MVIKINRKVEANETHTHTNPAFLCTLGDVMAGRFYRLSVSKSILQFYHLARLQRPTPVRHYLSAFQTIRPFPANYF